MTINRRRFIRLSGAALALAPYVTVVRAAQSERKMPLAEAFDREMESFMAARQIPGGALAVVKDRKLVYARGYGWADREKKIPAQADSLFRIASISKPITAVAILKLVEQRKLSLSAPAFGLLKLPSAGTVLGDARFGRITIQQLLQHTGGWDRDKSFDPMFRPVQIARETESPAPASPDNVIRYMLTRELDFEPGTRRAYSNFGYCVLGRIIEKITGQPYEQYVREKILKAANITSMRLGASLDGKQAPGEARYYTREEDLARNVFPGGPERVPRPYGGFHLEAMDAHGGWIASAIDLARFAAALDQPGSSPLLKRRTFPGMYAPPPPPVSRKPDGALEETYFGCGWAVRPMGANGRANYWHNGSLPGTCSLLVRRADGLSWAALFNQRSEDPNLPDAEIDSALHRAAGAVEAWPRQNLFPRTRNRWGFLR